MERKALGEYPFLLMDAIVVKVRTGGRVVSRSIMASTGINPEGYREILGLKIGDSESYQGWSEYLGWLKKRGLTKKSVVAKESYAFSLMKDLQSGW